MRTEDDGSRRWPFSGVCMRMRTDLRSIAGGVLESRPRLVVKDNASSNNLIT